MKRIIELGIYNSERIFFKKHLYMPLLNNNEKKVITLRIDEIFITYEPFYMRLQP